MDTLQAGDTARALKWDQAEMSAKLRAKEIEPFQEGSSMFSILLGTVVTFFCPGFRFLITSTLPNIAHINIAQHERA